MSDDNPNVPDDTSRDYLPPAEAAPADDDADLIGATTEVGGDGKKYIKVPLDTVVGLRRGARDANRRVKELEPLQGRLQQMEEHYAQVHPYVKALVDNPRLLAEARRGVHGAEAQQAADVATEQIDTDAREQAEDNNWYLADGYTPDVAKGKRALERMRRVSRASAEEIVKPLATYTMQQSGGSNIATLKNWRDPDGTPYATPESIDEVAQMIGPQLAANPQVAEVMAQMAIGRDRMKGRTPRPVDEPLVLDRQGGRRSGVAMTADLKRSLEKVGLSEKDFAAADKQVATGRAITFE